MTDKQHDQQLLDEFFGYIRETITQYAKWTNEQPTKIFINTNIMRKLSETQGFYQRPEVRSTEVTAHAPVVRRFRIGDVVLTLYDRFDEPFLRIE